MSAIAERLLQELLQLPIDEREEIIGRLYEGTEESELDLGPEWNEELRRRIEDHERGKTKGVPFDEAMKMVVAEDKDDAAA